MTIYVILVVPAKKYRHIVCFTEIERHLLQWNPFVFKRGSYWSFFQISSRLPLLRGLTSLQFVPAKRLPLHHTCGLRLRTHCSDRVHLLYARGHCREIHRYLLAFEVRKFPVVVPKQHSPTSNELH